MRKEDSCRQGRACTDKTQQVHLGELKIGWKAIGIWSSKQGPDQKGPLHAKLRVFVFCLYFLYSHHGGKLWEEF